MQDRDKVLLRFKVTNTTLERLNEDRQLPAGSKGVLRAYFVLTGVWLHMDKVAATFYASNGTEQAVLLEDRHCNVPDAVTRGPRFVVQLVGIDADGAMVYSSKATVRQAM